MLSDSLKPCLPSVERSATPELRQLPLRPKASGPAQGQAAGVVRAPKAVAAAVLVGRARKMNVKQVFRSCLSFGSFLYVFC